MFWSDITKYIRSIVFKNELKRGDFAVKRLCDDWQELTLILDSISTKVLGYSGTIEDGLYAVEFTYENSLGSLTKETILVQFEQNIDTKKPLEVYGSIVKYARIRTKNDGRPNHLFNIVMDFHTASGVESEYLDISRIRIKRII